MTHAAVPLETHERPTSAVEAVLARVRALCRRRILWLEHLASDAARRPEARDALGRALLDVDAPEAEARFLSAEPEARALLREADALERRIFEADDSRLAHLAEALGLTPTERDLLQVCLAGAVDPSLALVFGALTGVEGAAAPTEPLAARLCGYGRTALWGPTSALSRWRVLAVESRAPGQPDALGIEPPMLSYLLGASEIDPALLGCCTVLNTGPEPLPGWPVARTAERIARALERGVPSRVQVMGAPLSGRKTFAAAVARALGSPLMVVDTARVEEDQWPDVRLRVLRQALLHDCAVAWTGPAARRGLEADPGLLALEFTILDSPEELVPAVGWHEERVTIPALTSAERRDLWLRFIPGARAWDDESLRHLSERFRATIGEIAHVAAQGDDRFEDVQRRARDLSHGKLGDLAVLLDCPFHRGDLFLPPQLGALLDAFLFEARDRTAFWEQAGARRLFPRGTGLVALLSGPPGTGKTMAAQVIAAELGLDLFRIDLASTVNKYIGETAKNLRRLFARATDMNAVLLFDEADALFSRRTDTRDAHDRYANADTTYLLQLIEEYPGIALLATNKRQQMDDAFVRRIRYVFYVPRPEPPQRLAIWRQVVSELASPACAARLDADLRRLAADTPMTGAQIKTTVLAAVFLAREAGRPLAPEDIAGGLNRHLVNQGGPIAAEPGRGRR
ncbi:AAA family ATPase [Roseospira navarrensis]|uniref:AAA family ATPase n=1 Tax=Roseospira navarrensis TaxID=140058 RepID=A0A7X1ZG14_9PROT|nr:ATP-binding protein [Roseospira navarrensis]MQX37653.1 AAA family ATPase [Roseospira navarrensis]